VWLCTELFLTSWVAIDFDLELCCRPSEGSMPRRGSCFGCQEASGSSSDGRSQHGVRAQDPATPAAPTVHSYLAACIERRELIKDLLASYSPSDGRFSAYSSEAKALWHVRDRLYECRKALEGAHRPGGCACFTVSALQQVALLACTTRLTR
jgi:hypothetical protein